MSTTVINEASLSFGLDLHGTDPNDLVQFDHLDLGLSSTGERYVLMILDGHSGYI